MWPQYTDYCTRVFQNVWISLVMVVRNDPGRFWNRRVFLSHDETSSFPDSLPLRRHSAGEQFLRAPLGFQYITHVDHDFPTPCNETTTKRLPYCPIPRPSVSMVLICSLLHISCVNCLQTDFKLISNSYVIYSSDVYKIGSFQMQDKAYYHAGGKPYSPSYTFKSRNGYGFTIDKAVLKGVIYKQELRDTLQYHELAFTVYSDKETFERFRKTRKPIHIDVLQFQIGSKNYIDLNQVNHSMKIRLIAHLILSLVLFLFMVYSYYKKGNILKDE
jgi:hypothetical protein